MDHQTNSVLVEAVIPTRGLIGFESDLVNLTQRTRYHVSPLQGIRPQRAKSRRGNGVLVAMEGGISHRLRAR